MDNKKIGDKWFTDNCQFHYKKRSNFMKQRVNFSFKDKVFIP